MWLIGFSKTPDLNLIDTFSSASAFLRRALQAFQQAPQRAIELLVAGLPPRLPGIIRSRLIDLGREFRRIGTDGD